MAEHLARTGARWIRERRGRRAPRRRAASRAGASGVVAKTPLLSLYALKEVVAHCSQQQIKGVADVLWVPLFENSENSGETASNLTAVYLRKLATTRPPLVHSGFYAY
ncbi:hypothetical protein DFH09DRAFT_218934 [Mycena vulgaris]|nr:hypothetical protein DFH09DRAFT_218934 [Mycena vulgaris]